MACKQTEYGVVTTIYRSETPNILALRRIVKNFDESMEALGLDPLDHEEQAVLTTRYNGMYGTAAWYLKLHAESCCYHG